MRNENGFGTIVCLDKTGKKRRKPYAVRITTGWKDGKQVRKYLGYYKTQSQALIALAEYHKEGVNLDTTKLTLEEVYQEWIKRKEQTLSVSALRNHEMCHNRFGKLANMPMREIKKIHLQKWLDGIDLKAGTKGKLKSTMHQLFEYALGYDIVQKNYAKSLEIPEKIEKVGAIFTEDEIKTLWQHSDDKFVQYILILIYTGVRISELLDMSRTTIFLNQNYMVGGVKTDAGKDRTIPIHPCIKPFIEQNLEKGNYITNSTHGGTMTYMGFSNRFKQTMEKLEMVHKIHDTRKTAVSLFHSSGIPIETVRVIVGHSGKGVTEKVYLYKTPLELYNEILKVKVPNL